ncbi:hypothetical protein [Arthrobacter globiformis]|uniref:hypothetical protein n=1 Tax=Arthrobacter globiformis TaxID=1665 RepID=UPI00278A3A2E|nr:hypothetical protein [Arthrobacter globiformis]MDQ0867283.1 hypothetical protein [Arthrobacter globiformis]
MTERDHNSTPGMIEVRVGSHAEVDAALDGAIGTVRNAATRHQTGIMVTRTGPGRYIVRAHPAVPFGLIREQHQQDLA